MTHPKCSLSLLKLVPGEAAICALPECFNEPPSDDSVGSNAAFRISCTGCSDAPALDFSGDRLKDISYCSASHRDQDQHTHEEVCRSLQWLRDAERIVDLHRSVFLISLEETYQRVLTRVEEGDVHKLFFDVTTGPAPEQPFCGLEIDEANRLVALCLNSCVYATQVGAPLIAYMTQERGFSNSILHIYVTPNKRVNAWWVDPFEEIEVEGFMHSIIRLAPTFLALPTDDGTWTRDGVISDASAEQLFFHSEHCSRSDDYHQKAKPNSYNTRFKLDAFLNAFADGLSDTADRITWERLQQLISGAAFRVVNNVLYPELQRRGGAKDLLSLPYCCFAKAKQEILVEVRAGLKKLRGKIDQILYKSGLAELERQIAVEELMDESDGEGHREMMEILWESLIN